MVAGPVHLLAGLLPALLGGLAVEPSEELGPPPEIEVHLLLAADAATRQTALREVLAGLGIDIEPTPKLYTLAYLDSPDRALRQSGWVVRVRNRLSAPDGQTVRSELTVKRRSPALAQLGQLPSCGERASQIDVFAERRLYATAIELELAPGELASLEGRALLAVLHGRCGSLAADLAPLLARPDVGAPGLARRQRFASSPRAQLLREELEITLEHWEMPTANGTVTLSELSLTAPQRLEPALSRLAAELRQSLVAADLLARDSPRSKSDLYFEAFASTSRGAEDAGSAGAPRSP